MNQIKKAAVGNLHLQNNALYMHITLRNYAECIVS